MMISGGEKRKTGRPSRFKTRLPYKKVPPISGAPREIRGPAEQRGKAKFSHVPLRNAPSLHEVPPFSEGLKCTVVNDFIPPHDPRRNNRSEAITLRNFVKHLREALAE